MKANLYVQGMLASVKRRLFMLDLLNRKSNDEALVQQSVFTHFKGYMVADVLFAVSIVLPRGVRNTGHFSLNIFRLCRHLRGKSYLPNHF